MPVLQPFEGGGEQVGKADEHRGGIGYQEDEDGNGGNQL